MVAGILEKSKRLRKAFFIVKRLPISGAAEGRTKPRIVGRFVSCGNPRRGTYLLEPCLIEPCVFEPVRQNQLATIKTSYRRNLAKVKLFHQNPYQQNPVTPRT